MVLKIQGKVAFALDESRDNKKWHQQVKEASEWKMKHTRIKKRKEKVTKNKIKPLLPNMSGKTEQGIEGWGSW